MKTAPRIAPRQSLGTSLGTGVLALVLTAILALTQPTVVEAVAASATDRSAAFDLSQNRPTSRFLKQPARFPQHGR